jgi:hypothetical protein
MSSSTSLSMEPRQGSVTTAIIDSSASEDQHKMNANLYRTLMHHVQEPRDRPWNRLAQSPDVGWTREAPPALPAP